MALPLGGGREREVIVIKDVWKSYSGVPVLERINLSIKKNEFISIVGTSGYGKTTFLNLLLGVEQVSRGVILIDGQAVSTEPGTDCGIVFQRYSVFPHMSVLDNVMVARGFQRRGVTGKFFGRQKVQVRDDAIEMLRKVGLSDVLGLYPHELSGGMRQRLALAQALFAKPRLLLLDEPFGALDPGIRKDMQRLLLALWRKYDLTVIMITHSLPEAFYLGTRVIVFDKLCDDHATCKALGATITYDLPVRSAI